MKDKNKILVVGRHGLAETLEKESGLSDGFVMLAASSDFETALMLVRGKPSLVVLDMPLAPAFVEKIAAEMAGQEDLKDSKLLITGDPPGDLSGINFGTKPVFSRREELAGKLTEIMKKLKKTL